ncbi:coiled-coil domain-containing protein AGAP005037-like isoform X4 [Argiope bruennichi]|uniref:coiled-coil domain-containing protein AGAP005037-like isoform X4 n=1 Tax=Argiope bruennichi TaxID=94029 RepID=UPI002494705B|nr:coiled-coil domain-containing protein AGAP005037-like isoform X4 [Argiope bruennichi]
MPFSIKRFTMHRSTSLPGGRSSEGKKISLTELPNSSSRSSKKSDKSKSSSSSSSSQQQQQQQQQQQMQQLPNSRSMDVSELRRLGNPRQGPPPELLADAMAATGNQMSSSSSSSSSSTMDRQRRALHSIQEHPSGPLSGRFTPQLQQPSPKGGYGGSNTATLPARWRSSLPPRPSSEMRGSFSDTGSSGGSGTEVRRLVVRKNGVRFQESDWAADENHSVGNNKGGGGRGGGVGPPTIRPPSSLSKRAAEWESDSGHMSDVLPRGSQTLKRPQPRRHHTVGFETGSMSSLPRPSLDLESHLPNQKSHSLYQPPSSVYDEDPGIMSEVETSATGFRRASKARSSLPIVRTPSKTQERPLGLVFLQYQSETKRALLPNEITSMDTVRALFVRSFPKQLTMEYLDSPHIRVYIHDPAKDMFYELEDLRDIRDRSVLRIYEQDVNGGGVYSTYDQDLSYFSEPEFDSEYQHQHIHRSKASKAPLPPALGYYGTLPAQYLPANRTQTLPHSTSMRNYSPTHQKNMPPGGGGTLPPPKPQRSFQQALTPLGKTVRSTPPPTGPPPSIPSPRSGQPRPLVPIGSTMPISPERRHEPLGSYRAAPPDRPYSVAGQATYHISPERRYDPSYHSSPERRSQQESGYLSSPERRVDHQRSFSGYSTSSSYEESLYGGSIYGTRSGSVTPVIDEEASIHRLRMEYMERQLASLTGLVQKALTTGPPNKNQTPQQQQQQQQLQQIPTKDNNQIMKDGTIKVHLTPEMYVQLRHLRKQTKDLRLEVRNLRRIAQAQSVTARDTVRETCVKIKTMLAQAQSGEDQVCAERLRVSREEDLYRQDVTRLEKDLTELETHVEELRSNVINRKCRVNMSDVEGMALVLSRASKTVADLKARFPNLQDSLKSVMAAEMEVVVREEKFLKEEPDRLENALRRCKKLTGTLVTLKRLASVQEQRNTGAHPTPDKSSSSEGNHSDGEVQTVKTIASDPHTVIHVPPGGGHQRASENALDALLDELQTFTKPLEQPRDNIPGLLGPQRRLPSYPSAESPVRSPARSFAPSMPGQPEATNSAFRAPATITSKLQVSESPGQRTVLSPSHSPVPDSKKNSSSQEMIMRVAVNPGGNTKQTVIDGVEGTVTNPVAQKKAPPPPPPRTTSRSPLTSPTADNQEPVPGSPRDVVFSQLRSNSAPAGETENSVKKSVGPRSVSRDEGMSQKEKEDEELLRTSAISEESVRRETLSSNSSSSESVNSQEGLQVSPAGGKMGAPSEGGTPTKGSKKLGPPTPPRSRVDVLEQRHQELLRKQKLLQDQYSRLQQLQNSQLLQRFSPSRSAASTPVLNDLKKTGSESNILLKSALVPTASSGSLTHLAGNAVHFNPKEMKSPAVVTTSSSSSANKAPAVPAKPTSATSIQKTKIYETDIL